MASLFRKHHWRCLTAATIALALSGPGIAAGPAAQGKYQPASSKAEVRKAAQAGLAAAGLPSLKSSIALVVDLVDGHAISKKPSSSIRPTSTC